MEGEIWIKAYEIRNVSRTQHFYPARLGVVYFDSSGGCRTGVRLCYTSQAVRGNYFRFRIWQDAGKAKPRATCRTLHSNHLPQVPAMRRGTETGRVGRTLP